MITTTRMQVPASRIREALATRDLAHGVDTYIHIRTGRRSAVRPGVGIGVMCRIATRWLDEQGTDAHLTIVQHSPNVPQDEAVITICQTLAT